LPPLILQIYRERLQPPSHAAYDEVEREIASVCIEFGFPHSYLAIESLAGPEEVWFLNGWESEAEQEQVAGEYAKNAPLVEALERNAKRKAGLKLKAVELFGRYRPDLSCGAPWSMGLGRFLAIAETKVERQIDGTVFETPDGTKFVISPAKTRREAEAVAGARVFGVRPDWSKPAPEWIAADPDFWRKK